MPSPLIRNNKQDENEISSFSSTITRVQLLGWVTVYKKKCSKVNAARQGKTRQGKAKESQDCNAATYICVHAVVYMYDES